jgi:hypothetical protein
MRNSRTVALSWRSHGLVQVSFKRGRTPDGANGNPLFRVMARNFDFYDFVTTDEFVCFVTVVGSSVIITCVFWQIRINRMLCDYYARIYDPTKKTPAEKYAKGSKFTFRPRKLTAEQENMRDII